MLRLLFCLAALYDNSSIFFLYVSIMLKTHPRPACFDVSRCYSFVRRLLFVC